jgi:RNA polymerase primary sigma factor
LDEKAKKLEALKLARQTKLENKAQEKKQREERQKARETKKQEIALRKEQRALEREKRLKEKEANLLKRLHDKEIRAEERQKAREENKSKKREAAAIAIQQRKQAKIDKKIIQRQTKLYVQALEKLEKEKDLNQRKNLLELRKKRKQQEKEIKKQLRVEAKKIREQLKRELANLQESYRNQNTIRTREQKQKIARKKQEVQLEQKRMVLAFSSALKKQNETKRNELKHELQERRKSLNDQQNILLKKKEREIKKSLDFQNRHLGFPYRPEWDKEQRNYHIDIQYIPFVKDLPKDLAVIVEQYNGLLDGVFQSVDLIAKNQEKSVYEITHKLAEANALLHRFNGETGYSVPAQYYKWINARIFQPTLSYENYMQQLNDIRNKPFPVMKVKKPKEEKHIVFQALPAEQMQLVHLLPDYIQEIVHYASGVTDGKSWTSEQIAQNKDISEKMVIKLYGQGKNLLSYISGNTDVPLLDIYKEWFEFCAGKEMIPFSEYVANLERPRLFEGVEPVDIEALEQATKPVDSEIVQTLVDKDDLIGLYFQEIQRTPLLTQEEEYALFADLARHRRVTVKLNDRYDPYPDYSYTEYGLRLKNECARRNTRLVVSNAKDIMRRRGTFSFDQVEDGNEGLMVAIDKYQLERGFRFSTFATSWIRQKITRGIANHSRSIRMPVHAHDWAMNAYKMKISLTNEYRREPTDEEIASHMGISVAKYRTRLQRSYVASSLVPLDQPMDDDDESTIGDFISDKSPDILSTVSDSIDHEEILAVLNATLSPRESFVMRYRYGFVDGESHTLEETSQKFNVTRERIRQIEDVSIKKLKRDGQVLRLLKSR